MWACHFKAINWQHFFSIAQSWSFEKKNFFWKTCVYYLVKVIVTPLCPALCNPTGCSPQGSSVHGLLLARILKWVVILFSRGSSWPRDWNWVSPSLQADCLLSESPGSSIYYFKLNNFPILNFFWKDGWHWSMYLSMLQSSINSYFPDDKCTML